MRKKTVKTQRRAKAQPKRKVRPLWNSRMLLASIVASSDDAIIGKDLEGVITSWNHGAERIYGYTAKEAIGKHVSILIPEDRPDEFSQILQKIRSGKKVDHYQSVRVDKDGRRLNVSVTVSPIRDAKGKIVGASAIARDITALNRTQQAWQESESRAHALFQAAAQAIFIVDQSGRIVMANPATEKMLGYNADELLGQSIDVLVPEKLRAGHVKHRAQYFSHLQNRPMGLGLDLQARRKDGTEFFAEISLSYIESAHGTLAVAFVTDISKRKADEQAIRQHREDLRTLAGRLMTAQDDERRRIARDLHDDLSQKLAYLAMDIGKLATKPGAQGQVSDLRPLQMRAAEAAESVRRISHQLHPSILDDIGLEAALEQYCEEFEERSGITTQFTSRDVPDSLPPEVASSVYHIFQECLRNVSKHAKAESVTVTLEFTNNVLRLTVKDEGVGVAQNLLQPGASIGIVGMKERAHLVNGTFSIQSRSGEGTEVSVDVPLATTA